MEVNNQVNTIFSKGLTTQDRSHSCKYPFSQEALTTQDRSQIM